MVLTKTALQHDFHVPTDNIRLHVPMVEAIDDSYITATTLATCQETCLCVEQFQSYYGSKTDWKKSRLYILNSPSPPPNRVIMLTVNSYCPFDPTINYIAEVDVISDHLTFLHTPIDNPKKQFLTLRDLINNFQFPSLICRLPFTALSRILSQTLISKIRPRLLFQPLMQPDAEKLDKLIATKIHSYLRFPFPPSSSLLTLPLAQFSFDFPSIALINIEATITGATDLPSQANDAVDKHATQTQKYLVRPPTAPLPTFYMDDFVLYYLRAGFIEWPV
ncbi:hypothetical protein E1B28_002634 [Marasmius oreades]|uniref:Uncharacterized protein n=1 Tax=Marasmius oreades TaxID=181124 RepID=A0A9P7RN44_9AGAR|nr:uncharacterized protein E1B28_002634 [Marasmius oreades]KAG7086696.1 hypothetical protein E1B28_002634 [Marasmius oreades]